MEKYRIAFTVQDYFDYVGTNPNYSIKDRMLFSIPDIFKENGYNIKFKVIKHRLFSWDKFYRVHMSVRMSEEEIKKVFKFESKCMRKFDNYSYKLITKHF